MTEQDIRINAYECGKYSAQAKINLIDAEHFLKTGIYSLSADKQQTVRQAYRRYRLLHDVYDKIEKYSGSKQVIVTVYHLACELQRQWHEFVSVINEVAYEHNNVEEGNDKVDVSYIREWSSEISVYSCFLSGNRPAVPKFGARIV